MNSFACITLLRKMAQVSIRTIDGFVVPNCSRFFEFSAFRFQPENGVVGLPVAHHALKVILKCLDHCREHPRKTVETPQYKQQMFGRLDLVGYWTRYIPSEWDREQFAIPALCGNNAPEITRAFLTLVDVTSIVARFSISPLEHICMDLLADYMYSGRANAALPTNVEAFVAKYGQKLNSNINTVLLADTSSPEFVDPAALADMLGGLELGLGEFPAG